jgi:hypothetical protein
MAKEVIKQYLDNRAKTDELFAQAYAKPNKSIDECMQYIMGEAKKQGGSAVCISDEVVFGWAVHYYDEDDIKINKVSGRASVSAPTSQVELTEEEKQKAKEQAMENYRNKCVEEMKRKEREKQKAIAEKKKQIDNSQLSLF